MRDARRGDHKRHALKRNYSTAMRMVAFNEFRGINDELTFSNGLTVLCGLNGVGKSSVSLAIKWLAGCPLEERDLHVLGENAFRGSVTIDGDEKTDVGRDDIVGAIREKTLFVDCVRTVERQRHFFAQDNFDEVLEQYEPIPLDAKDLEELRCLTSKEYEECTIFVIEDSVSGSDDGIPFFSVREVNGASYDSRGMGSGEHSLFYLYYLLRFVVESGSKSLAIIEEPESFVSVQSQRNFMSFLYRVMDDKGLSVILTTHSPAILEDVDYGNIRIISRFNGRTTIRTPRSHHEVEGALGLPSPRSTFVLVEDEVAKLSLLELMAGEDPTLHKRVQVEVAKGFDGIKTTLEAVSEMPSLADVVIGVFDGDMRNNDSLARMQNKEHAFYLPFEQSFEDCLMQRVHDKQSLERICNRVGVSYGAVESKLGEIACMDSHDWLSAFAEILAVDKASLVRMCVNEFLNDIEQRDSYKSFRRLFDCVNGCAEY